jgi:hypothetical protein
MTIYPWQDLHLSSIRSNAITIERLPNESTKITQDAYLAVVLLSGDYSLEIKALAPSLPPSYAPALRRREVASSNNGSSSVSRKCRQSVSMKLVQDMRAQWKELNLYIGQFDEELVTFAKEKEDAARLSSISGQYSHI